MVILEGKLCCSAHCKWRCICDQDQPRKSFSVAGPVFEDFWHARKCCCSPWKVTLVARRVAEWWLHARIILALWSDRSRHENYVAFLLAKIFCQILEIVFAWQAQYSVVLGKTPLLFRALYLTFQIWHGSIIRIILYGRGNIWWCWRVSSLAPRIVNDVAYCDEDEPRKSFPVAGPVFEDFWHARKCWCWAWKMTSVARRVAEWWFHA